jgi:hypothetical protein
VWRAPTVWGAQIDPNIGVPVAARRKARRSLAPG